MSMIIWYFETSAVNTLMNKLSLEDALATKHLQLNKGRDWRISPVTLWEILMTSDENLRDDLIYFCQHLFGRELMPSPAELIIPYIKQGMPINETPRPLISNTQIANTWRSLVDDRRSSIHVDHDDLRKKVKLFQRFTKNIHLLIKNKDLLLSGDELFAGLDCTLGNLVDQLPFVVGGEVVTPSERLIYKASIYYIMMILCAEVELENDPIQEFWKDVGVDKTGDRIFYVVKKLSTLVHRGPFMIMSLMTIAQGTGKYHRGVWLDSLHSMYLTYVSKIFSSDGHFEGLKSAIPADVLKSRICMIDDVEWKYFNVNQFGVANT